MSAPARRSFRVRLLVPALLVVGGGAHAFPGLLEDWQQRYGAISPSGDNAQCQLCHADATGGSPWNGYGWDILVARETLRGGWIFVLPGTDRELADPTNRLSITKSGLHLIGISTQTKRVVLQNAGNQRNGIVAVPSDRTECMTCHASLAPTFPLVAGAAPEEMKSTEPKIHGLVISGFTIQDFQNNGLFTENVDRFAIVDVRFVGNATTGSSRRCRATGSSATAMRRARTTPGSGWRPRRTCASPTAWSGTT
jgi:hypothetical protein